MPAKMPPLVTVTDFMTQYAAKMRRDDGCLVWVGGRNGEGYGAVNRNGRVQPVHRLLFELTHGALPVGTVVDHMCYRRECVDVTHLRAATHKENMRHRAVLPSNNTSGARGVSWDRAAKKWEAHVTVNDKKVYLGKFATVGEASVVATAARVRHFGAFAGVA